MRTSMSTIKATLPKVCPRGCNIFVVHCSTRTTAAQSAAERPTLEAPGRLGFFVAPRAVAHNLRQGPILALSFAPLVSQTHAAPGQT